MGVTFIQKMYKNNSCQVAGSPEQLFSVKKYDSPSAGTNPEGGASCSFLVSMYTGFPVYERPANFVKKNKW